MEKLQIAVSALAGICLLGIIGLLSIGKDISVLLPIVTALVGWLLGKNNEAVVGFFRRK